MATIIFGLFVASILVAAFATDTDYSVERSIITDRPAPVVFDYIRYLINQDDYSEWGTMTSICTKSTGELMARLGSFRAGMEMKIRVMLNKKLSGSWIISESILNFALLNPLIESLMLT